MQLTIFDNDSVRLVWRHEDALRFDVADLRTRVVNWNGRFIGHVHPTLEWQTRFIGPIGAETSEPVPPRLRATS